MASGRLGMYYRLGFALLSLVLTDKLVEGLLVIQAEPLYEDEVNVQIPLRALACGLATGNKKVLSTSLMFQGDVGQVIDDRRVQFTSSDAEDDVNFATFRLGG
jgi:hypothetical protein